MAAVVHTLIRQPQLVYAEAVRGAPVREHEGGGVGQGEVWGWGEEEKDVRGGEEELWKELRDEFQL